MVRARAPEQQRHENLVYAHLMRQYEATADFLTAHLGAAK